MRVCLRVRVAWGRNEQGAEYVREVCVRNTFESTSESMSEGMCKNIGEYA